MLAPLGVWFLEMNLINLHLNPNIESDPEVLILKIDFETNIFVEYYNSNK
jgi:hypothetical protein